MERRLSGFALVVLAAVFAAPAPVAAERLKNIASIAGVRDNQLAGYGLVVGLDGSGDQTTQTPFTVQSIVNMLSNMGVTLPQGTNLQLKNVAAVMVTASLPAYVRPGQTVDITVSSIGNAKSLKGGTLVMTPLKGIDGQIYAIAQGNMVVAAPAGTGPGAQAPSHLSAGRIPGGATVERAVPSTVGEGGRITVELQRSDFATARRVADAINKLEKGSAQAVDGRSIEVRTPTDLSARIAFLGQIEDLDVNMGPTVARVVVNSRTGSVVMNQTVNLQSCAVAHGNLAVMVEGEQAAAQNQGMTGSLREVRGGTNLAEVVRALNTLGAKPTDLVSILQAMKAAGALRAELEVI
ncbi:flagellar P-ring protein [Betaproteobacteria bacterium]|nr:flagellar P-ring protein [Betaproteobacteria bacterium]